MWLRETAEFVAARAGLERLGDDSGPVVSAAIEESLERVRPAVVERDDHVLYAGMASDPTPPWSWLRRGTLDSYLSEDDDRIDAVVGLGLEGALAAEDEVLFAERVGRNRALCDAYLREVRSATAELHAMRWSPGWSLDVIVGSGPHDAEALQASRLFELRLPHAQAGLAVHQHEEGWLWRVPGHPAEVVDWSVTEHEWREEWLDRMWTKLVPHQPTAAQDAWHGVGGLIDVAKGRGGARGVEVARSVALALESGAMGETIARAHAAFEAGTDLEPEVERLLAHAFHGRMVLDDAAAALIRRGSRSVPWWMPSPAPTRRTVTMVRRPFWCRTSCTGS